MAGTSPWSAALVGEPRHRQHEVLLHALAELIACTDALGARMLLRGGLLQPLRRCHPVLLEPLSPVVEETGELVLVLSLALLLRDPAQLLRVLGRRHRGPRLQIQCGAT